MSVVGEDALDSEPISNRTPEKGDFECPEKPGGPSPAKEDKEIALPNHGRRPRGRPRKTAALTPATTGSGSSLPSPGDGDASTMTLDCHTQASDSGQQKMAKPQEVSEQPVKKKRGRRPLPSELRARKLRKTSAEASSRESHPPIKVQLPPDSVTASSTDPLEVPCDQSGSSGGEGQNGVQVSAGPQNGQQKAKRTRELSKELRDEIVLRHTSGEGYKKIAKSLDIACSTVRGVVVKWKVHRTTDTLPRSGCPSKLSNETKSRLVAEVIVRPTVTLKELKSTIAEMGVIASETTIARSLHQAGLYYKVANKVETKESCSDAESNVNERPEQGNTECPVETSIPSPKEQEKEIALPNHGKRPRGRPRKIPKEAQPEVANEGPVKKKTWEETTASRASS
ncbi:hypothetical protein GJAV_G00267230 [Gymnothorax javanicus]|nr:hypothetical protein GJAV_G00267230 [Gymnothorax javanicus]